MAVDSVFLVVIYKKVRHNNFYQIPCGSLVLLAHSEAPRAAADPLLASSVLFASHYDGY